MVDAEKLEKYKLLNQSAQKNGIVFFGADWLSDIPVAEIARDRGVDEAVYNRSLRGMTVSDAQELVDDCISQLSPCKVFINIGENDVKGESFNIDDFAEKFEWLLYIINSKCRCKIYILPVAANGCSAVNNRISDIAQKYSCEYVDINIRRFSMKDFFRQLSFFLRSKPITFSEAMNI